MQTLVDLKKLYDEDEHLWLFENARLLREGRVDLADIEHIAETLEDMGKRDFREILSRLIILIGHLLKWKFQKEARSSGWKGTINEQRLKLNLEFEDSKNLENYGRESFSGAYRKARSLASSDTGLPLSLFPSEPPFTFEDTVNENYFPE